MQEDVDVIRRELLSGAHMTLIPKIVALLAQASADARCGGGVIPDEECPR